MLSKIYRGERERRNSQLSLFRNALVQSVRVKDIAHAVIEGVHDIDAGVAAG